MFVLTDPERRGAQIFAHDLSGSLSQAGCDVRVVALAPPRGTHVGTMLDVPTLGPRRLGPTTLSRLRREVRKSSVTVACGSTTLPAVAIAGIATSVPFVYRSIGDLGFWAGRPDRRLRVKAALHRTDAVVVLWSAAKQTVIEGFGVPEARVRVIPNGVSAYSFPLATARSRIESRTRLVLPDHAVVVAIVGSLSYEKRVHLAIDAAALLPADHFLVVVGDGPERSSLERRARERAPNRVCFTGQLADTSAVYAAADAVVLTSVSEGMPAVLIEAGLSGRPAVSTDVGAANEVIDSGISGRIVPVDVSPAGLADALREVLQSADVMGRAAYRRCSERFEMANVSRAWQSLLDDVSRGTVS